MSGRARLLLLQVILAVAGSAQNTPNLCRDDFPSDFVFGAGTSAYQVEGAAAEDGRTPSIWDTFTHQGKAAHNSTGDVAADGYHKYKEDVKLMSEIGLEGYRFSISWSRLLPKGRGATNPKGIEYYNKLINELHKHSIQPHVTLFHFDLPQILEEEYGGWLSQKIIKDFTAYANVCFREFGDRVSHWTTLNEPNVMSLASYDMGILPPQRCSNINGRSNCAAGNSSIEPYIAMHHLLLAHASAAKLYKRKYQKKQKGLIGLNLFAYWTNSVTNSVADIEAKQRTLDFYIGWAINPLMFGDYPEIMKKIVGSRIPSFTKYESKLLKGSFDFIGLNHYVTLKITDNPNKTRVPTDFSGDLGVTFLGSVSNSPPGLQSLLEYFKDHYGNPPVYIQENGYGSPNNETLNDIARIKYLAGFMESILHAVRNGANTRGYFVWSFVDVFELLNGYQLKFGLVHVNYEDQKRKREPKMSAQWYSKFLKGKGKGKREGKMGKNADYRTL